MRRAGTGRSVWLENSQGFDRWCGLQRFGDPGGPVLDPRVTRIAARRVDTHVPRESSLLAAGRIRRVLPGVSTGRVPKRVGERGGKKKRASPNRRPRSRPRGEATSARDAEPRTGCALTSRVRTNVPRAFRANGCASRVCRRGEAPVGGGSLSRRHLKISFDNSSHLSDVREEHNT